MKTSRILEIIMALILAILCAIATGFHIAAGEWYHAIVFGAVGALAIKQITVILKGSGW